MWDTNGNGVIDNGVDKSLKKLNIAGAPDDRKRPQKLQDLRRQQGERTDRKPEDHDDRRRCAQLSSAAARAQAAMSRATPAITITGGNPGDIYGGGSDGGTVTGSPKIAVTGGKATLSTAAAGEADLTGNPVIELTGGEGAPLGGGSRTGNGSGGNVTGNTSVTVESSAKVGRHCLRRRPRRYSQRQGHREL